MQNVSKKSRREQQNAGKLLKQNSWFIGSSSGLAADYKKGTFWRVSQKKTWREASIISSTDSENLKESLQTRDKVKGHCSKNRPGSALEAAAARRETSRNPRLPVRAGIVRRRNGAAFDMDSGEMEKCCVVS